MARRLREEVAGGVQHVYARGNNRERIFFDHRDRNIYLAILGRTVARTRWRCLAYCLMDNHVHLLVETPEPNLAVGMQRLHGDYAQTLNERHGRCGHVFQGRYGSVPVRDERQLWTLVRYIAQNPAEAGISVRMHDWRWSSHPVVLGAIGPDCLDTERLLAHFSALGGDPLARYRDLIG